MAYLKYIDRLPFALALMGSHGIGSVIHAGYNHVYFGHNPQPVYSLMSPVTFDYETQGFAGSVFPLPQINVERECGYSALSSLPPLASLIRPVGRWFMANGNALATPASQTSFASLKFSWLTLPEDAERVAIRTNAWNGLTVDDQTDDTTSTLRYQRHSAGLVARRK